MTMTTPQQHHAAGNRGGGDKGKAVSDGRKHFSPMAFIRKWTLPCAMLTGTTVYLLFAYAEPLRPVGEAVSPYVVDALPVVIFAMLYVTFCKIQTEDMRPRPWHFRLQGVRTLLSAILVAATILAPTAEAKLVFEGLFICVICPTASAAPVITEKLGGSIASLTVYTVIANVVTAIIIPLFFPMVEKGTHITFLTAFAVILRRVTVVLLLPLCLALLTRRFLPRVADAVKRQTNLAFYMWAFNLSVMMGLTLHNIINSEVSGLTMALLVMLPMLVALLLFSVGKAIGGRYGERISAGQALGQKNTMVGLWLTVTFLNPTAAVAPCAYVVWQNMVNAWQLWCKDKYGELKW